MSRPDKFPFKSIINIQKGRKPAVYLQIARQIIQAAQQQLLLPGFKLPGSRMLSEDLQVHRKTVVAAYKELEAQGWIEVIPNKGSFIVKPTTAPHIVPSRNSIHPAFANQTGYTFKRAMLLDKLPEPLTVGLEFTDGLPDIRIAPIGHLANLISSVMKRKNNRRYLAYTSSEGNDYYREALSEYLNTTRGLHLRKENILATRGTLMAIFLIATVLISPGDLVIVGNPGYYQANMIFQHAGASLLQVPVDSHGIPTEAIRELCSRYRIRMVYLTPSHHYPTTATMPAERRKDILGLAAKYGFVILEDDEEYSFHYSGTPVLPLASHDTAGMVVYVSSFCKTLAPGLEMGYLVAPENLIEELSRHKQMIDPHGHRVMEQAMAEFITEGELLRHLKKAVKIYHDRRDLFCSLLEQALGEYVDFKCPDGGLSVWTQWKPSINLLRMSKNCNRNGLFLPQTLLYQNEAMTAIKLGFGHLNTGELEEAVSIVKNAVMEMQR